MKLLTKLERNASFWFLLTISVVFFLLRLPSLFEPYWYGDEGVYEVIGFALRNGRLLYSGIWDNKPPMLYLIYALFSGDQFAAKFLSLLVGILSLVAIFFLGKKLFHKQLPTYITTAFFALFFAIPLTEGNIANAENFMLLPAILAGFLVYISANLNAPYKILHTKYLFLAGFLLGLSFLTKVVAMFDLSAFIVFIGILSLSELNLSSLFVAVKKIFPLLFGFLLPLVACAGFFVLHHTFSIFLRSTLFSNVAYVNYGNQFVIPQGFLILKTLLVGIVVLFFFLKRNAISKEVLFIFLWVGFALYSALFSGRPYTHYALVLLPSFSLLVGLFFADKKARILTGASIIFLLIVVLRSFTFYGHAVAYYENFLQFVSGQKSETAYQTFFDSVTPRDYAIAQFINSQKKPGQSIFIWGNSGQIYKLTSMLPLGRFFVAYHMMMAPQNLVETQRVLQEHQPTFVIVLPKQDTIPFSLAHYKEVLTIASAVIYENSF